NALNQTYQLDLSPAIFFEYSTVERFARYLQRTYATILGPHFATASPVNQRVKADNMLPNLTTPADYYRIKDISLGERKDPAATPPIAIIGMSGAFPQAPDVQSLWRNLREGRDCISVIPQERWDWQSYFGDPATEANKTNVKWAGILEGIELFDPIFFGIS